MNVTSLVLGLVAAFLGVFLLADVPGRLNRSLDPAAREKLARTPGGLGMQSRRTHIAFGVLFLVLAAILIVSSL